MFVKRSSSWVVFLVIALAMVPMLACSGASKTGGMGSGVEPIVGFWAPEGEETDLVVEIRADGSIALPGEPEQHLVERCAEQGDLEVAEQCTGRWSVSEGVYLLEDAHLHDGQDGGCECSYRAVPVSVEGDALVITDDEEMTFLRVAAP